MSDVSCHHVSNPLLPSMAWYNALSAKGLPARCSLCTVHVGDMFLWALWRLVRTMFTSEGCAFWVVVYYSLDVVLNFYTLLLLFLHSLYTSIPTKAFAAHPAVWSRKTKRREWERHGLRQKKNNVFLKVTDGECRHKGMALDMGQRAISLTAQANGRWLPKKKGRSRVSGVICSSKKSSLINPP